MSGPVPPRDDVWCFLVARRAVARAALRLGATSLSREALDSLAAVLLAYVERCAGLVGLAAESSRRPAANALDALVSVPLFTSPAVQRVHWGGQLGAAGAAAGESGGAGEPGAAAGPSTSHGPDPAHDLTWRGLAAFMFGPNWEDHTFDGEESDDGEGDGEHVGNERDRTSRSKGSSVARPRVPGAGKVGPSSSSAASDVAAAFLPSNDGPDGAPGGGGMGAGGSPVLDGGGGGWCAPYPDELPPFPVRTTPGPPLSWDDAPLPAVGAVKEAPGENEAENAIPDAAFFPVTSEWGGTAGAAAGDKRVRDGDAMDEGEDDTVLPPAKRAKVSTPATSSDREALVPRFLPPFPQPRDVSRAVVESAAPFSSLSPSGASATGARLGAAADGAEDDPGLLVRSSLVALPAPPTTAAPFLRALPQRGQYWGSGWDAAAKVDDDQSTVIDLRRLAVPWGRPAADASAPAGTAVGAATASGGPPPTTSSSSAASAAAASATLGTAAAAAVAPIVPLGRASGSRVSRILEGSMDGS